MLTCEQKAYLHQTTKKLSQTPLQERKVLLEQSAKVLGVSVKTVRRYLEKETGWKPIRKHVLTRGVLLLTMNMLLRFISPKNCNKGKW